MVLCNSLKTLQFTENVRKSPAESLMTRLSSHRIVRELHTECKYDAAIPSVNQEC